MKRLILVFFATLGGLVFLTLALLLVLNRAFFSPAALPGELVLEVNIEDGLVEAFPQDPFLMTLERRRLRTRDVVEAIDEAARDDRVLGVLVRGSGGLPGWGTAEELREALERFRGMEKPVAFFAETFGELSPGQLSYHLATAADQIYLQPSGEVGLAPLVLEAPFLRGLLDRFDIEPRFDRRGEYKEASELFTEREFTPQSREAATQLLTSLEASLLEGLVAGRGVSVDRALELLSAGPYPAREARELGLVDELLYLDEARSALHDRVGGSPESVGVESYLERGRRGWDRGPRVALVYGVGSIHRGRSGYDPLSGSGSLGASTVAAHLREAVADPAVEAILFRVNSPGGSWVASDQVRREIRRAREEGIPVVVSMSDVAASGGYVISMDADRIVAHPSTFTGSIGVVAGRFVTREGFESAGIDWDRVQNTEGMNFYSAVDDFSPEGWERFQEFLDRIYEDFVDGVAEGRGMSVEEVDRVARGRVWSGRDALELGLVDRLGGFGTALDQVRELLELESDAELDVAVYPEERTLLQVLLEEGRGREWAGTGAAAEAFALLRPVLRWAAEAGITEVPGPVRTPLPKVPGR